uniref:HTH psq-type domain-containing protein n=1 Tax=Bactrocera dorsalis TaxID=27457 RepID=A0A034VGU3_BACDO
MNCAYICYFSLCIGTALAVLYNGEAPKQKSETVVGALQQQQQQQRVPQATLAHVANAAAAMAAASATTNSNANSEDDDSGDDSNSNQAYEEHNKYRMQQKVAANNMKATQAAAAAGAHLDSTIEDDHNYVAAHDEDSSYCASADTEHESSANASLLNMLAAQANSGAANTGEMSGSLKRVRRSEASLAQAAKCVSKGQTFQTVSNMFNIPVSTIRFYMARKGILPRRKRGRGASSAVSSVSAGSGGIMTATAAATMAQALSQMKRAESPSGFPAHQLVSGASVGGKAHI